MNLDIWLLKHTIRTTLTSAGSSKKKSCHPDTFWTELGVARGSVRYANDDDDDDDAFDDDLELASPPLWNCSIRDCNSNSRTLSGPMGSGGIRNEKEVSLRHDSRRWPSPPQGGQRWNSTYSRPRPWIMVCGADIHHVESLAVKQDSIGCRPSCDEHPTTRTSACWTGRTVRYPATLRMSSGVNDFL